MNNFYAGTSGLVMPVSKALYPAEFQGKGRLEYYSSLYNSIEINSSFYKLPLKTTVVKWAQSVPQHFRFTFKMPKSITHNKSLDFNSEDLEKFMEIISGCSRKGCVLIQFPPGLYIHLTRLEQLLNLIKTSDPENEWTIAIEFRHPSWYTETVYRLMEQFNVTMVQHDIPGKSPPPDEYDSDVIYLRLIISFMNMRDIYATGYII